MESIGIYDIKRIARVFLGSEKNGASLIVSPILGKGFVNKVWLAEASGHKMIIRLNAEDSRAAAIYRKEQWCMERAEQAGIPGARTLDQGEYKGVPYIIQSFEEGVNGLDSPVDPLFIWQQIGRHARCIHAIPTEGYGEELAEPAQHLFRSPPHPGSDGSWAGYIRYNIESLNENDPLLRLGIFSVDQSKLIRDLLGRMEKQTFHFGLNHGDLSLKNVLVDVRGPEAPPRIVLLDWGSAEVYPVPHGDLIQLIQTRFRDGCPKTAEIKAFLRGYGLGRDLEDDTYNLMVLRALDKLRWAIDCSPRHIEECASFAKYAVKEWEVHNKG